MRDYEKIIVVLTLAGCSEPLPQDKLAYAGEWQSEEMYLLILADGSVAYQRVQNGGNTSVNGPIKEFVGDDFIVGFAFFTAAFEVTQVPTEIDGTWTMVVDGMTLVRSRN